MAAIKTDKLRKEYKDVVAVEELDLEIKEGELFALLGVNGAGKTTTIKMLTGLTKPTSGDAFIYGHSVVGEPDAIKGMVDISTQETAVARKLTVEENIDFCAKIAGLEEAEAEAAKKRVTAQFGLEKVAKKQARKLSGGWQRKLSVALALVTEPRVLFLDEPTLGLDVIARRELWKAISSLKGKMTVILTTHYMEEAEALADRIAVMINGRITDIGTLGELEEKTGKKGLEEVFIEIADRNR